MPRHKDALFFSRASDYPGLFYGHKVRHDEVASVLGCRKGKHTAFRPPCIPDEKCTLPEGCCEGVLGCRGVRAGRDKSLVNAFRKNEAPGKHIRVFIEEQVPRARHRFIMFIQYLVCGSYCVSDPQQCICKGGPPSAGVVVLCAVGTKRPEEVRNSRT